MIDSAIMRKEAICISTMLQGLIKQRTAPNITPSILTVYGQVRELHSRTEECNTEVAGPALLNGKTMEENTAEVFAWQCDMFNADTHIY